MRTAEAIAAYNHDRIPTVDRRQCLQRRGPRWRRILQADSGGRRLSGRVVGAVTSVVLDRKTESAPVRGPTPTDDALPNRHEFPSCRSMPRLRRPRRQDRAGIRPLLRRSSPRGSGYRALRSRVSDVFHPVPNSDHGRVLASRAVGDRRNVGTGGRQSDPALANRRDAGRKGAKRILVHRRERRRILVHDTHHWRQ